MFYMKLLVAALLFLPFFAALYTGVAFAIWGVNPGHWFVRKGGS